MKTINVVAAILQDGNKIYATQRGYGKFKGFWEFPGGKIDEGECAYEALHRELLEELKIKIDIDSLFCTLDYDYDDFHLHMQCFLCTIKEGTPVLVEHQNALWLDAANLDSVTWLPADISIIEKLKTYLTEGK
ncbi:8-oxo-dGTP diphosphatase [Anaerobiospirillum thomasii]|uniref:8-oxo-dGTP diphosphatase n=1 Tax=Anaerobiospirillum thomasii TaxID=179995 RepID=A0A2X0WML3_9GAMM|nr:(deoxy)nucleoside triphosphate pyrophosphohydrolase [Anaerobiospirillum thomasii]SPT69761.1 8-oxo-dGTP diphosphatase [Anaerobiospirillum thomasii]SPT71687.1 8-oxo-dGTP diphosphatase [Anaerobiospirillum thomasii]